MKPKVRCLVDNFRRVAAFTGNQQFRGFLTDFLEYVIRALRVQG